jgi:phasin family protein
LIKHGETLYFNHAALQQQCGYKRNLTNLLINLPEKIMLTPEQIISAQKTNASTVFGLSEKAFEGVEKLIELNMAAGKAAINETMSHAQSLLSIKDPQEFISIQSAMFQPMAEKLSSYGRHVYDITSATATEFTKTTEEKIAEAQHTFTSLLDATSKNAPAGTESAVALFKSAYVAGTNALESVQKAVKHATEVAESNIQTAANTAMNATKAASKKRAS